jgi:hypothetical protein
MDRSTRSPERLAEKGRRRSRRAVAGAGSETRACLECYGDVMNVMPSSERGAHMRLRRPVAVLACAVAVALLALSPAAVGDTATTSTAGGATQLVALGGTGTTSGQSAQPTLATGKASASASLAECATATIPQTERAATFAGEMSAIPGSTRMEIRIDLEERAPGELLYRTISAPGLGLWHSSVAGVKVFTHIQQVTNLSAPASYRGVVRFRWLSAKGRLLKTAALRTAVCEQPAPLTEASGETTTSGTGSTGTPTTGAGS